MRLKNISRRNFIKTAGVGGIGAMLGSQAADGSENNKTEVQSRMPTRPFGRTGIEVPILSLGGMFDIPNNQLAIYLKVLEELKF